MSKIEREWWFIAPVMALTDLLTTKLFMLAGFQIGNFDAYQAWIYFICMFGMERIISPLMRVILISIFRLFVVHALISR